MNIDFRSYARKLGLGKLLLKIKHPQRYYHFSIIRMPDPINNFFKALAFYIYNSWLTNFPSYKIRTFYLRQVLKISIGKKSSIHMGCFFAGNEIIIGSNTVIARKCYLDGRAGLITICNNVSMAPECYILSMTHLVNSSSFEAVSKAVLIEDYTWLGARCMVMPGVHTGIGSVLAASSVVTKNVDAYTVVAGVPAKKIADRNRNLDYQLSYFPYFNSDIT
jgi:maltose O-acetyltransferase